MKLLRKGFTLIELLVVIGILAVLMAGVVTLINPLEKNRQALDAKVFSDIGQMSSSVQAIAATTTDGAYPCAAAAAGCLNQSVNMNAYLGSGANASGELAAVPVPPNGGAAPFSAYTYFAGAGAAARPLEFELWAKLGSQKYNGQCTAANPQAWYIFDSANGRACIQCRNAAPAAFAAGAAACDINL